MADNIVFDKAKYHFESVESEGLPLEQAYVHTGMYFGWLLENGLCSQDFYPPSAVDDFKARKITGPKLYEQDDGVLMSEMLTEEGDSFSRAYFDFETGKYLADYEALVTGVGANILSGKDTWENYDKLRARIDQRYAEWKALVKRA
jgi:hypothetical protein